MAPKPAASGPSAPSSHAKRKAGPPGANARSDGFQQKRAKIIAARNIPAQPADDGLRDGELDLQAFIAAREFEIRSLEQSMAASKTTATSRAFQQVPRGMRRRTASHNPKRVPRRLRARARREMAEDNTPTVEARRRKPRTTRARIRAETARRLAILALRKKNKRLKTGDETSDKADGNTHAAKGKKPHITTRKPRPKIRRNQLNEPQKPAAKFRKRQINKTWLPTHLWHTKRARMTEPKEPLWRFAIPITPNEKVYRPTHRAQGNRGTLVWDMSYMSTIGVYGQGPGMERVLRAIGVTQESSWNDRGKSWRMGTKAWNGLLSRQVGEARRPIGPAMILWNPEPPRSSEDSASKKVQRQILIRIHPSAFLETFHELLRLVKSENPKVYIEDLRFEIGSIELTGPASTEALLASITPYPGKNPENSNHGAAFQALKGLTNPGSLPANAVLGFSMQDPRLRYPPRRVETRDDYDSQMKLLETIAEWPVNEKPQPYGIFDRDARFKASCLPTQKSLNRRKSQTPPGKFLAPTSVDPPIPIALVASRSGSGSATQPQGTWTLLAPWRCVLPLWYSLVHVPLASGGNPLFAGLDEARQVAFERGLPHFPADFPGTDAGVQWELDQRARRQRAWERKPKSKRVAWTSLDLGAGRKGEVGNGLACDFEFLFGMPAPGSDTTQDTTVTPGVDAMDVDQQEPASPTQSQDSSPLKLLNHITKTTFTALLSPSPTASIPPYAIIQARLSIIGRGVVSPGARVYRLPSQYAPQATSSAAEIPASIPPPGASPCLPHDLRAQWLARASPRGQSARQRSAAQVTRATDLETRKRLLAQELLAPPPAAADAAAAPNQRDVGGHPLVPDVQDLVGFVTAGSFCLSEGRGVAMASLAAERLLPRVREDAREGSLCVVRNTGENVGWLARWEAI